MDEKKETARQSMLLKEAIEQRNRHFNAYNELEMEHKRKKETYLKATAEFKYK